MSDKHTPVWSLSKNTEGDKSLILEQGEDIAIVADFKFYVPPKTMEKMVAQLNVTADLYEALNDLFEARNSDGGEWTDACLKAKRALAKAKGGAE